MMPRFEDQENMDDEEMELVLNAIEYIKGSNYTEIQFRFQLNFLGENSRVETRHFAYARVKARMWKDYVFR